MILQCPSCEARFLVNDAAIPIGGRSVRCGRCKNEWHVEPNPIPMDLPPALQPKKPEPVFANFEDALAAASAEQATEIAKSALSKPRLPTVKKAEFNPNRYAMTAAALALILLAFVPFAYYPSLKSTPPFSGFYKMMGWKPSEGLIFADVTFEKKQLANKETEYTIAGNIVNHAKKDRAVSNVRVALKTKEGDTIWSRTYQDPKVLKAGETYPFTIPDVKTAFGDRVRTVVMDIGNDYELGLR